ncbi:MAG: response regulator, partial [Gammaproteobacteria bacterium]|nr:response regulator [Gammaproteobacteria bacterium]
DGYEATRRIRREAAFVGLPIIAMTANAMVGDKERVIAAGMNDHISKPLNVNAMFATMAQWITPAKPLELTAAAVGGVVAEPLFTAMPGIDTEAGLATTMQNQKLYTRLLIKFRESQGAFAALFAAALQDADPEAATRCAHTLKGTAGNIGAKGVQAAAAELEQACLKGEEAETIALLLANTLAELQPVIAGLQDVTADETAVPDAAVITDFARIDQLLDQLKGLLEESDSDAADVLDELLALVKGTPLASQLSQVTKAVAAYDFDAALEQLPRSGHA